MSRKSAIAVATTPADIFAHKRPDPPDTLDNEAADEWRKVVQTMPPEWFTPETHAILEDRCRQVVWQRQTAKRINELAKKKLTNGSSKESKEYYFLIKLAMNQSRTLTMLDTRMRLTQQSTYDKSKRKHAKSGPKRPWDSKQKEG